MKSLRNLPQCVRFLFDEMSVFNVDESPVTANPMKTDLHRFLHELREWLCAVDSIQTSFGPACRHLKKRIDTDLECLEHDVPFDGILKGLDGLPSGIATKPEADDPPVPSGS
jgi:hypothetical protein